MTKIEYINKIIQFTITKGLFEFMRGRGLLDYHFANDRIIEIESAIAALKKIGYNEQG